MPKSAIVGAAGSAAGWERAAAGRSSEAAAPSSCSEVAAARQSCPGTAPDTGSGAPRDSRPREAPGIGFGGWVAPDSNSAAEPPQSAAVDLL